MIGLKRLREEDNQEKRSEISKLYENNDFNNIFYSAIWELEIVQNYFNFEFSLPLKVRESRTNTPISLQIDYKEEKEFKFCFQVEDPESFPKEEKESDYVQEASLTEELQKSTEDKVIGSLIPSSQKNNFDYCAQITIHFRGKISTYSVGINEGITKWIKIPFDLELQQRISSRFLLDSKYQLFIEIKLYKKTRDDVIPYCGLINEGTTCYLNSLIQMLFMLKYFKKSIMKIKIPKTAYKTSKIFSMQKLFYDMITSTERGHKAVETKPLLASLGLGRDQMHIQHDAQEFLINLSETLGRELASSKEENILQYLFQGKAVTKIQCLNVPVESSKQETFTDIQLPIKGCRDIYSSFDKYTEEELLSGSNQYETDKYGKQDARKKTLFVSLPKVLIIQLNRFEYNSQSGMMEKINDKFDFYDHISLTKYTVDGHGDSNYTCCCVVVHRGNGNSGHYYSFIRPEIKGPWYKFNDRIVTYVEKYEVFNNNFGGRSVSYRIDGRAITEFRQENQTSAYLLIYLKNSSIPELLGKFTANDIPTETLSLFNYEKKQNEIEEMLQYRKKHFVDVVIVTREVLESRWNFGVVDNFYVGFQKKEDEKRNGIILSIHRDTCVGNLINVIAAVTGIREKKLFLYQLTMKERPNCFDKFNYIGKYLSFKNYYENLSKLFRLEAGEKCYFYVHCETRNILTRAPECPLVDPEEYNEKEEKFEFAPEFETIETEGNTQSGTDKRNLFVYYDNRKNAWKFVKKNSNEVSQRKSYDIFFNPPNPDSNSLEEDKTLIVVKYPNLRLDYNNTEFQMDLKIEEVFQVDKNNTLSNIVSKKQLMKSVISKLPEKMKNELTAKISFVDINYFIEYSSLNNFFKSGPPNLVVPFQSNYDFRVNKAISGYKNDILCLNVSLTFLSAEKYPLTPVCSISSFRELINMRLNSQFLRVETCFCIGRVNLNKEKNIGPLELNLETKTVEIKKKIATLLNEDLICKIFSSGNDIYKTIKYVYYDNRVQSEPIANDIIAIIKEEKNLDVIELIPYAENISSIIDSKYPLLKYINTSKRNQIDFKINLQNVFRKEKVQSYNVIVESVLLCDLYSTPLVKLFIPLSKPKNEFCFSTISTKIKSYLEETKGFFNFYPEENNKFYFIVQNPRTLIAYDISFDSSEKSLSYYDKYDREIRYQPYMSTEYKSKIFICLYEEKTPIGFPMVIFFDINATKVGKFKEVICNMLYHNNYLRNRYGITQEDVRDSRRKFKFSKCTLKDYCPCSLELMSRDEYLLNMYQKGIKESSNPFNVCVQIMFK